jgi:hypothetical protein
MLARKHGFRVHFIGQNGVAQVELGRCPVLIWYEHTPNHAEDDPQIALAAAGIRGLEAAQLSTIRSATGFVVRADAP